MLRGLNARGREDSGVPIILTLTLPSSTPEAQMSPTQCLAAHEVSSKLPKYPGEWWQGPSALSAEGGSPNLASLHSFTQHVFVGTLIRSLTHLVPPSFRHSFCHSLMLK